MQVLTAICNLKNNYVLYYEKTKSYMKEKNTYDYESTVTSLRKKINIIIIITQNKVWF